MTSLKAGGAINGRVLYAEDVARLRGVSRWQARRMLVAMEAESGEEAVGTTRGRRGVRRYTTLAALGRFGPEGRVDLDLEGRVRALERRVAELETWPS